MEKKTFNVTCTLVYNGNFNIEANNENEALVTMYDRLAETAFPGCIEGFEFGEVTTDYTDEV